MTDFIIVIIKQKDSRRPLNCKRHILIHTNDGMDVQDVREIVTLGRLQPVLKKISFNTFTGRFLRKYQGRGRRASRTRAAREIPGEWLHERANW